MVDYDPYSHEAMTDPRPLYAQLRAEDPVHYLERYNTWALATFEPVWQVCLDTANFTCTRGQTPNQVMLGEPTGHTFPELDPPEHRSRRRVLAGDYTREMAPADEQVARELARRILDPLVAAAREAGEGTMDVYRDYAIRVTARVAARKAGVPEDEAEELRHRMDDMFAREPGQRGSSEANLRAIGDVFAYLAELIASARREPASARGHLATMLAVEPDGAPLTDEEIAAELHTIMVTASETTELAVAGTVYYLSRDRVQLDQVLADRSLVPWAFAETVRYDHPTNMLCRSVRAEAVDVGGKTLRYGQGVLLLWGSANCDEAVFPDADRYDVHRRPERTLLFGHGQHKCLGEHLAMRVGSAILDELLARVADYEVDDAGCGRLYGEFLKGYNRMPIRFTPA